jgi:hypothetical protein
MECFEKDCCLALAHLRTRANPRVVEPVSLKE